MIREEIKKMKQKRLLSRKQFDLLMKLPDRRLEKLISVLMTDVFQLTEKDLEALVKARTDQGFEKKLREIKRRISDEDFSLHEKSLLYSMSKFFAHLDFKKSDEDVFKQEMSFLIERVISPCFEILHYYKEKGFLSEKDLAVLKESASQLFSQRESDS